MKEINIYDAVRVMRRLSKDSVPFSIEFVSCDRSRKTSQGLIRVDKAILTQGLRKNQSEFSQNLIAYEDTDTKERRQFWLPLLMKFNGLKITYDRIY